MSTAWSIPAHKGLANFVKLKVFQGDTLQVSMVDNTRGNGQSPDWVDSFYISRRLGSNELPYSADVGLSTQVTRQ